MELNWKSVRGLLLVWLVASVVYGAWTPDTNTLLGTLWGGFVLACVYCAFAWSRLLNAHRRWLAEERTKVKELTTELERLRGNSDADSAE